MTTSESERSSPFEGKSDMESHQLPSLSLDITARFTDVELVFDIDVAFDVSPGETVVVLGPSGSGKTLVLETIGGFHQHAGEITLDGEDIMDRSPEDRGFGFVFQDYALFPHMNVRENVAFGQQFHQESTDEELPDPDTLLARLGVDSLAERSPRTLSGGEQQRVALARSLAIQPDMMLLDEPLAALDVPTQQALRDDLADVLADVTAVYVTHNRTTARAIADRIVVMQDGQIVQRGSPEDVFERPQSPMVARFTGSNVIDLSAAPSLRRIFDDTIQSQARSDGSGRNLVDHDGETHEVDTDAADHVAIRPEAITLGDVDGDLSATVERVVREDATNRVTLAFDDVTVEAFATSPPVVDTEISLTFPRGRLHLC